MKALNVDGPANGYVTGKRLGKGWVAAHIWRTTAGNDLATRNPLLYTFTPNLVWLPKQIAKLSDIDGGPVQTALKSISFALYRSARTDGTKHAIAEQAWSFLPDHEVGQNLVDLARLSYFSESEKTIAMRLKRTKEVFDALTKIKMGEETKEKVVSGRYTSGLPLVPEEARSRLLWILEKHI